MTPEEIKVLQDKNAVLEAEVAKHKKAGEIELAVSAVSSILKEANIPYSEKLVKRACADPVIKEGKPDTEWVKSIALDFSEGVTGQVTGMGHVQESAVEGMTEAETKTVESAFRELGMNDKAAAVAAKGVA